MRLKDVVCVPEKHTLDCSLVEPERRNRTEFTSLEFTQRVKSQTAGGEIKGDNEI